MNVAVTLHTSAGRKKLTDNNIFFKADKRIGFALNSCIGENSCGFLEGSRRQEGIGSKRSLCDTEKHRFAGGRSKLLTLCLALCADALVLFVEVGLFNGSSGKKLGLTRLIHLELSHHLTNDNLNVLIIDINTLHTIGLLNFLDKVVVNRIDAVDGEYVVGIGSTLCKSGTLLYEYRVAVFILIAVELLAEAVRYKVGFVFGRLGIGDDNVLILFDFAE